MTEISRSYEIKASIDDVWKALVDPEQIVVWTGETAVMRPEEGFEFSLWGGDIWGTNRVVIPNQELEQDWYSGAWDKPSKVSIVLFPEGETTRISLTHTDFPATEKDDLTQGWDDYYFGAIKEYLESKH